MKICVNNKANHQDYRGFQEVSKDNLRELLDSILNEFEAIYSLSICIEYKDDYKIKEISDATKQLTPKDLEKLGLTKNKKNNG